MLPSLRDQITVLVSPEQLRLVRTGAQLTRRGLSERVLDKKSIPCIADGEYSWSAALQALQEALGGVKPASARVILSNQFVHYAMVPWNEALSNDREAVALARHSFVQLYGASADAWVLRTNQDAPGAELLACGIDPRLLESLRVMFVAAKFRLKSVQPALMAAYNNGKSSLRGRNGWFVQYEEGCLCLALLQQGRCRSVRTLRVGDDWQEMLPVILEREAYLTELDVSSDEIYLWAPEQGKVGLPVGGRWHLTRMQAVIRHGLMPEYEGRYTMAMMSL